MWSLFRRNTRPAQPARRTPLPYRPRLEVLEDRLCPSGGALDPSFGTGGEVSLPWATNDASTAVAIQPDGKIVSVGVVPGKGAYQEIAIVRLNPNGSLDKTFNKTGIVDLKVGVYADVGSVAIQPDGKILIGGTDYSSPKDYQGFSNSEIMIARFNPNGSPDTTFANHGVFTWDRLPSAGDSAGALTVLPDGSIVAIAGTNNINNDNVIFKLKSNGAMDTSFGTNGTVTFQQVPTTLLSDMAVAPNGDLIVSGSTYGKSVGLLFAVKSSNGAPDPIFNGQAWLAVTDPAGDQFAFNTVAIQGNEIVVGGNFYVPNQGGYGLVARFNMDGTPDTSFANGGYYVMPTTGGSFNNLVVLSDGSLIAEGSVENGYLTVVHFANGPSGTQLDTTFGNNGYAVITGAEGTGLAVEPINGDIVVSGYDGPNVTGQRMAFFAMLTPPG